jgi:hypothetical protein
MCASLWEAWTSAATGGREARTCWPTNSDCGALRRPSCCEQPFCSPPRDPYHDAPSFCFHGRHKNFGASVPARSICNLRYLLVPLHTSPVVQSIQDNPCIHSRATKKKKYATGTDRFVRSYCTFVPKRILRQLFGQFVKIEIFVNRC